MDKILMGLLVFLGIAVVIGAHGKDRRACEAAGGELGWTCRDKACNHVSPH